MYSTSNYFPGSADFVPDGSTTSPFPINSLLYPGTNKSVYQLNANSVLTKTLAAGLDISAFTSLCLWYYSFDYAGRFLQLGIGKNAPNEYTHIIQVVEARIWGQDTWDISAIPQATLQAIKYFTITSELGTLTLRTVSPITSTLQYPRVAFDGLTARRPTLSEGMGRAIFTMFNNVMSLTDDNSTTPVPCLFREPELTLEKFPAFLYHLDAPVLDTYNNGRGNTERSRREFLNLGSNNYGWSVSRARYPYVVRLQMDVIAKYELDLFRMQEFLLGLLEPYGAILVDGDLIDCVLTETVTLDTQEAEQRILRSTYVYEIHTWLETPSLQVPAAQTVEFLMDYSTPGISGTPD
jgi:hypothetical protein